MTIPINQQLDALFDTWSNTYPEAEKIYFHRDGIVCEDDFVVQPRRVVYVLPEPNDRGGAYYLTYGTDLRRLLSTELNRKAFNRNIGRWTGLLIDGVTTYEDISAIQARRQCRRVAIVNLKKLPGGAKADYRKVAEHAQTHRTRLLAQLAIIAPAIVVACGDRVRHIFLETLLQHEHCVFTGPRAWYCTTQSPSMAFTLLETYHPSCRSDRKAHYRLLAAAVDAGLVWARLGGDS